MTGCGIKLSPDRHKGMRKDVGSPSNSSTDPLVHNQDFPCSDDIPFIRVDDPRSTPPRAHLKDEHENDLKIQPGKDIDQSAGQSRSR
jgi:hypothetical protein